MKFIKGNSTRFIKHVSGKTLLAFLAIMFTSTLLFGDWDGSDTNVHTMGRVGIGTDSPANKLDIVDGLVSITHHSAGVYLKNNAEGYEDHNFLLVNNQNFFQIQKRNGTQWIENLFYINWEAGSSRFNGDLQAYKYESVSDSPSLWLRNTDSGYEEHNFVVVNHKDYFQVQKREGSQWILSPFRIDWNTGNTTFNGIIMAQAYSCLSDLRFKHNIEPIQNSLQKIMALNGVMYNWKTAQFKERGFSKDRQIGLVAQDVEKVLPELVMTGSDGYKSVQYDKLAAVLVEAMKEMNAKTVALEQKSSQFEEKSIKLEEKSAQLEEENKVLRKRLASFEKLSERIAQLERALEKGERLAVR